MAELQWRTQVTGPDKITLAIKSDVSGLINTREFPASLEGELLSWLYSNPEKRPLVEVAFPDLSEGEWAFLLRGAADEERTDEILKKAQG